MGIHIHLTTNRFGWQFWLSACCTVYMLGRAVAMYFFLFWSAFTCMCRDHKQFDFDAMLIRRMLLLVDNEIKCHIRVQNLEYSRFQENSKNSVVQKFWAIKYHVKFSFNFIHWFGRSWWIKSQVLFIYIDCFVRIRPEIQRMT